jgi:hypothetical protein
VHKNAIRYGVIASVLVVSAHAADAHGIAGNRFFVGTLTFDDPAVADKAVLLFLASIIWPRAATPLSTGLTGLFSGYSHPRSRFRLIAAGFIEAGRQRKHRGSTRLTLELKARLSKTMSTKH